MATQQERTVREIDEAWGELQKALAHVSPERMESLAWSNRGR